MRQPWATELSDILSIELTARRRCFHVDDLETTSFNRSSVILMAVLRWEVAAQFETSIVMESGMTMLTCFHVIQGCMKQMDRLWPEVNLRE